MVKKYYHYTSLENWKRIKKEGLIPYAMERIAENLKGIFLWRRMLKGVSHAGAIIYQMGTKRIEKVVLLEIECNKKGFELSENYGDYKQGDNIIVYHQGKIENLDYHRNEKGILYFKKIPTKNIKLIRIFELKKAWR